MDFQQTILSVKKEVERELLRFFQQKRMGAQRVDKNLLPIVDQIADSTLRGGKRTRAFLVWLGHRSVIPAHAGIQSIKDWIPDQVGDYALLHAMMALELFHSFCLIHDDIMDQDRQRRGGLSVHEFFRINALTRQRITPRNAKHFGTSMAILAGDLALVWVDELMQEVKSQEFPRSGIPLCGTKVKNEKTAQCVGPLEIYQHMKEEVAFGQVLDVAKQSGYAEIAQGKINELKTAWYSVVRPLQLGAVLAGADQDHLNGLADFGVPVGKLYQLKDDQMDGDADAATFQRESKRLTKAATGALEKLIVTDGTKPLFADLVKFVIERQS